MEVHQLRYFCAVARTGNFTQAAKQERVSQPSLSQQVLKLEDELGAKLFDRLGRISRVTKFGEAFLPRAEAILRQLGDARIEIREMAGASKGRVILGAIPTIAPYFLPERLTSFARVHPEVQVTVVEEITPVLLEQLHAARIDVALLALPVSGAELERDELLREPLYLVTPERHPLGTRTSVGLEEIEGEAFLLLKEGHCFRENVISACRRARLKPNVIFESGQFATILAMVSVGMGVSVVPRMAMEPRKGCRYVLIRDERAHRRIGLVQLKNHFATGAQRALLEHLRKGLSKRDLHPTEMGENCPTPRRALALVGSRSAGKMPPSPSASAKTGDPVNGKAAGGIVLK